MISAPVVSKELKTGGSRIINSKIVLISKKKLKKIFNQIIFRKKKIIGYGVTAKSTTILNYNLENN